MNFSVRSRWRVRLPWFMGRAASMPFRVEVADGASADGRSFTQQKKEEKMLKVTQHYSEDFRKCPVTEIEYTGEKFLFSASNVKRYQVKNPELHGVFVQIAAAAYASGKRIDALEIGRAAILVAQEAAKAGVSDMEFDLRTKEDRVRESEAAR